MNRQLPLRVMLVEDHALVRSAIRQALAAGGIEVVAEASSAEVALGIAVAERPDIVLVDIDLPGLNGIALVRELAHRLPGTRFVMLTVSDAESDLLDAVRAGASGYLTKDMTPAALVRTLEGVREGELAMARRTAARLVQRLVEVIERARATMPGSLPELSPRENEVLRLLADGLTDREIGEALTISRRTVESHVSSILAKLGVTSRAHAARRYRDA
jgi:DNA-binding NarL/FixJ family response regulator